MDHFQRAHRGALGLINDDGKAPLGSYCRRELELASRPTSFVRRSDNRTARSARQQKQRQTERSRDRLIQWGVRWRINRSTNRQKGSILVSLVLVWLPIIAVFTVILWIRAQSLHQLLRQRSLDRCLYPIIERRCLFLTRLSETNERLRQLVRTLAAIEIAKQVGSKIPVAGIGFATSGEAAATVLRQIANGIVKIQDGLITADRLNMPFILKCGFPVETTTAPEFDRPQTTETMLAKVTPPLNWSEGSASTEIHLHRANVESYAHCFTKTDTDDGALDGEAYQTSFQHAPAKRPSKSSFSLPSY